PSELEALDVPARDRRPGHAPAVGGRALRQGEPSRFIAEQTDYLARDRAGISPRHEDPAPLGQKLASVPVWGRDDGFARSEGIGQGPRGDLLGLEIGRDIDVRCAEKLGKLL